MSGLELAGALTGLFLAFAAIVKIILPLGRWARRAASRMSGTVDVVVGRDEFIDHATGKTVEAIPPLGTALYELRTEVRDGLGELTGVVQKLAEVITDQAEIRASVANHELRIHGLEVASEERIAMRQETTAALQLVRDKDALIVDPEED